MTDMIIHTLACVKYKKVHRQRGTGKRRSVFLFRRATDVHLTNVTPVSITDVTCRAIGFKPVCDVNVSFSYDNFTQADGNLKRVCSIPASIHGYQEEIISRVISAREALVGFTDSEASAPTLDITSMNGMHVSDLTKRWYSCVNGMREESVVQQHDTRNGGFLNSAFDIKLLKNPVINPTQV